MVFSKVKKAFKKKSLPVSERVIIEAQKKAAAEQKRKDEQAIKRAYEQARQKEKIRLAQQRGKASAMPLSQRIGQAAQSFGAVAGPPPKSKGKAKKAATGEGVLDLLTGPSSKPKAPTKTKPKTKKPTAVKINVGGQIITVHSKQKTKKKKKQTPPPKPPGIEDLFKGGGLF